MRENELAIFIELSESNLIFVVGEYDSEYNFKILETINIKIELLSQNKLIDIEKSNEQVKKNIQDLERKFNVVFKEVTIILDSFSYSFINISDFKKLNGSQLLKENISYILNSIKLSIIQNQKDKSILHIFNTKSILDGTVVENLPIGLFGDFYSHELSFFLVKNNDIKNIHKIFAQNNLIIKKILLKDFVSGVQLINQNKNDKSFFLIKLKKNTSHIVFFESSAMRYFEKFNFGSNILYKDIEKICSISNDLIFKIFREKIFKNPKFKNDDLLEEKFFIKKKYRKVRKQLILEIINARIEELADLILTENINLKFIKKKNFKIYLDIEDDLIMENFFSNFTDFLAGKNNLNVQLFRNDNTNKTIENAANLSIFGWGKEAIPTTQTKNSIITRIFKSIFG